MHHLKTVHLNCVEASPLKVCNASVKRPRPFLLFGATLRRLREARGLSQEGLAELAGVHRNYVGDVERGERNISLLNLLHFARALRVRPADLLAPFTDAEMRRLPPKSELPARRTEK